MSKKSLLRLLIPLALIAAAAVAYFLGVEHGRQEQTLLLNQGVSVGLLALALLGGVWSFLGETLDLPLIVWAAIALAVVIGVVFFYSFAIGVVGLILFLVMASAFAIS
jgi:hypothetical protein